MRVICSIRRLGRVVGEREQGKVGGGAPVYTGGLSNTLGSRREPLTRAKGGIKDQL